MHRRIASLVPLLLACACAPAQPEGWDEGIRIGKAPAAIQGGYVDDTDTHVVGIIHLSGFGVGACSGTLIAPNVVLTAQHCVANSGNGYVSCDNTSFSPPYPAEELLVTTRTEFTQNPADYRGGLEVHIPPGGPEFCGRDQAILILEESIPPEEAVPATPRVDIPLLGDEEYYAVGYGQIYENGPSGERHRRDQLFTYCVGFECPTQFRNYVFEPEWVGDTGVCQGDSGGPAFDLKNRVVGVASRGGQQCSSPVYGHVYGWGQWIKDVVIHAAQVGGYEPPAWTTGHPTDPEYNVPVGGACTQPADCPSNACLDGYCTRLCSEQAACPEGYQCRGDGFCEKIPPPAVEDDDDGKRRRRVGCTVTDVTSQDPTKPIPWKSGAIAIAGLALWLRRRRSSCDGAR